MIREIAVCCIALASAAAAEPRTEIPAKDIDPKWDFMYFIEAMDNVGNGRIYPDMDKETPYVVIKLDRERWIANRRVGRD
jgi:hypothetical protein